jgi:hypothetical protein
MYSRLNVLVNEINALGVKDISDLNINRKILQSLRKPDYDLVKAIIYEKKLEDLKPSHILSKIMAHELQLMPKTKKVPQEKPQEPSSPTTSHALSSRQEKMLSRMATHRSSCHTRLSEENQVHTYMHARIKFHAYSDIKVNTETVSRVKKKDYQRFTLNPGNEGSKHHMQSTGGSGESLTTGGEGQQGGRRRTSMAAGGGFTRR